MKLQSFFRSSGFTSSTEIITSSDEKLDLTGLSPFLRTLMVTDGTVTKSLEAWFWEPIKVEVLNNHSIISSGPVDGLEIIAGDRILQREVYLRGSHSDKLFAAARSTVSIKHLPDEIGDALEKGELGIGELLRQTGVETYRDIFDIDYFRTLPENDALLSKLDGKVLSRSYRIRVNTHPAIIVTEFFPIHLYE